MKNIPVLLFLTVLLSFSIGAGNDNDNTIERNSIVKTIIIDPGHGGRDYPGAVGPSGLLEKDVTLALALKLRELINADDTLRADGVRAILTRDRDKVVGLEERAAIANNADGDLFISIHTNSHPARSASGAETYFLSLKASDEHARMVSDIENQAFGDDESTATETTENDELKLILFDFIHKQYISESKFLAEHIQEEFNRSLDNRDRGVKQAPFRVLKGVAMPAVLVEIDFISNPKREQLMRSSSYQYRFANSMLRAIKDYKRIKERGYTVASPSEQTRENVQ